MVKGMGESSRRIRGSALSLAAMVWLLVLCGRECRGLGQGGDGEGRGILGRGEDDGACLEGSDAICESRGRIDDEEKVDEYHRGMVQIEFNLAGHATLQIEVPKNFSATPEQLEREFPLTTISAGDTCAMHGWAERQIPRKVWDAVTFFNEVDMLELRIETLWGVVDHFVVGEATRTHAGEPKPLHFQDSFLRFERYASKLVPIVIDDLPVSSDPWVLEEDQRNQLVRGLGGASPDDLVIIADVDEVPDPSAVRLLSSCDGWDASGAVHFLTRLYHFRFGIEFEKLWFHPQAVEKKLLDVWVANSIRMFRARPQQAIFDDAGWHMSFFADAKGVSTKLKACAHDHWRNAGMAEDTERISKGMQEGEDIFYGGFQNSSQVFGRLIKHDTCGGLPRPVYENPGKYSMWLPKDCDLA